MSSIEAFASWAVPILVIVSVVGAYVRRVDIFSVFVDGAMDGLKLSFSILPFIVGIWVAIGVFEQSGALASVVQAVGPALEYLGVPHELLPLMFIRPLSGAAGYGVATHLLQVYGPDSFLGKLTSTIQGSSETTFYVLTVYFGSVGVTRSRYALPICLLGDVVGYGAAIMWAHHLF